MNSSKKLLVASLAFAMSLAAAGAYAEKIAKWVDDKGVTHYGEKAPDGVKAQVVKVTDTTSSDADTEIERLNKSRSSSSDEGDGKPVDKAASDALDAENSKACDQHRTNLEILKSGKRARLIDDKGQPRALSDEERKQQIDFAESELKRCEQIENLKKLKSSSAAKPARRE